jgi:hypothetical protein
MPQKHGVVDLRLEHIYTTHTSQPNETPFTKNKIARAHTTPKVDNPQKRGAADLMSEQYQTNHLCYVLSNSNK